MINLLKETKAVIKKYNYKISDIKFIGSEKSGYSCSWKKFKQLANKKYDNSYGCVNVASDLIIVFYDNSRLWRNEYDSNEQWEYTNTFKEPVIKKQINNLFTVNFSSKLKEINE